MTVQELVDRLERLKDKDRIVNICTRLSPTVEHEDFRLERVDLGNEVSLLIDLRKPIRGVV